MKKLFGIALIIVLASSALVGCGKETGTGTTAATDTPAAATSPAASPAAESPAATSPAATDTPAASPAAASPAATDAPDEVVAAVDITDYPVMWCVEIPLHSNNYFPELTEDTYDGDDLLGTAWRGYRLIDDTHIEMFGHFRFNDDIDTSIMLSSQDESTIERILNFYSPPNLLQNAPASVAKINDREEEVIFATFNYEISGTKITVITAENQWGDVLSSFTGHFSSDFTGLKGDGSAEYPYRTDF